MLTVLIRGLLQPLALGSSSWWIAAVVALGVVGLAVWLQPEKAATNVTEPVLSSEIQPVIVERCAPCHSGASAPLGIRFETQEQIEARIDDIERQAVQTRAMPPGNATGITDQERALLAAWVASSR